MTEESFELLERALHEAHWAVASAEQKRSSVPPEEIEGYEGNLRDMRKKLEHLRHLYKEAQKFRPPAH
jgi:hypothetical protein